MERFAWFFEEVSSQISRLKSAIIAFLKSIPYLGKLPENQLEWIFVGIVLAFSLLIVIPVLKISFKIAVGAVALAAIVAFLTPYSFWGVLPFTGLGVAIVFFTNKFQMG